MLLPQPKLQSLATLLAVCLLATACGRTGESAPALDHALYLDPRPAGQTLSARAALDAASSWLHETRPDSGSASIQPWTYAGPKPRQGPSGGVLVPAENGPPPRFTLAWRDAAPDFDTLELDLVLFGECTAEVRWTFADGVSETQSFWVPYRPERAPLELFLGPRPTTAPLVELQVLPCADTPRELELFGLRLGQRGLGAPNNPPLAGDEGLLELGGLHRRVWPSLAGQAIVSSLIVPPSARLSTRAWAPLGLEDQAPFDPTCTLVVSAEGKARVVRLPQLPGSTTKGQPRSFRFEADLSEFAGERVELRFHSGGTASESGPLLGALWESPKLLPLTAVEGTQRPDIVLVTFDTTRADFAADARIAPRLAALGELGLVFTNAWSPSNTTTPAHASLFTGRMPHQHGAIAVGKYGLHGDAVTLAEVLREAGYVTAAVSSVEHIDAAHGFGQGFDLFAGGELGASRDGRRALAFARDFLGDEPLASAPRFLWVHWFDPHTPYELPADPPANFDQALPDDLPAVFAPREIPSWAREQLQLNWLARDAETQELHTAYARGVRYCDWLLGELCDTLEAAGDFDATLIAVTADHGEGLGEHGIFASHVSLLPPVLRIPLVLKPPGDFPKELWPTPASRTAPVSSLDLFPTILDLVGLQATRQELDERVGLAGHSLLAPDPRRLLWFEADRLSQVGVLGNGQLAIGTLRETDLHDGPKGQGVRRLAPGHHEAFDLGRDPRLERELFAFDEVGPELRAWLDEAHQRTLRGVDPSELERSLSPEETARLRALGYLGDE